MKTFQLLLLCCLGWLAVVHLPASAFAGDAAAPRKIVLIAGPITGHPKDTHEYEKNIILLKHLLDTSPGLRGKVTVETHFHGWPADEKTLDDADTILITSDGGDHRLTDHPFYVGNRMDVLDRQMKRGCGIVQFHWSTFNPVKAHDKITQWLGGYFDYESGPPPRKWRSAITTRGDWTVEPHAEHPIGRGVKPFKLKEEFYHHIRFLDDDPRLTAITTIGKGDKHEWTVGWAVERADGGRGFGFTGGHFYENWWNDDYRRLIINAIAWSAKLEIPAGGIDTTMAKRFRALILTGHNHPAHDWSSVTAALIGVIEQDPFAIAHVTENPEDLAVGKHNDYDVLVLNYCNWDRGGLSEAARKGFVDYVEGGGGLAVIHFANGAFNATLPAKDSDWAAFRSMVRRTWMHGEGRSGHDNLGPFKVDITEVKHPITAKLSSFETRDELYFRQEGDLPIQPLATAKSKVTGKDEPMAWAHGHGKGRVFQTVLGHDAGSIRDAGALIRRGTVWAAGRENLSFDPPAKVTEKLLFRGGSQWRPQVKASAPVDGANGAKPRAALDGAFAKALEGGLVVEGSQKFVDPPITVECWALVASKAGFNILIASEAKSSPTHWEIYSYAGSGVLSAYLPGTVEGEIKSNIDISDNQWHHVAMIYEARRVRLYLDGKLVKDQAISRREGKSQGGPLAFGRLVEGTIGLDGAIDNVRIRSGVHEIKEIPKAPVKKDEQTVGLWDFEVAVESFKPAVGTSGIAKNPDSAGTLGAKPQAAVGLDDAPWLQKESDWVDDRWSRTDLGPFFMCSMRTVGGDVMRAIAIRVGDKGEGTICFDSTDCVMRAGWTGGFLKMNPARYGLIRWPEMDGKAVFRSPRGMAGLKEAKYSRLALQGDRVIIEYAAQDATVIREFPWLETAGGITAITRTFDSPKRHNDLTLPIADASARVAIVGVGATLNRTGQLISIMLPKGDTRLNFKVLIASGDSDEAAFNALVAKSKLDVAPFDAGISKSRWTKAIETRGTRSPAAGPYVVDTIAVPFENPYNALFFTSGLDFINATTAAVSTIHGDVWMVTGIDDQLDKVTWRRFATGLYQPFGVVYSKKDDTIYVLGRDRITALKDTNGDGEADVYSEARLLPTTSAGGHDYAAGLEMNANGDLFYVDPKGVHRLMYKGGHETLATGFRNPIAMSVGPRGEVTVSPQEGQWTPASMISLIKPGASGAYSSGQYFGYGGPRVTPDRPLGYDLPLCFIPRHVDNSTGGQVWVTSDKWGPLTGQMLNLSFGMSTAQVVLRDETGRDTQGLIVPLKIRTSSGIMRGRFNPHDGQLYVTGMRGWQTNAVHDGCLQRIRYTGAKVHLPIAWQARTGAITLTFAHPLDRELAEDVAGYAMEQWNYRYSAEYGSKEWSVNQPDREGRDKVAIKGATLLADGRTLRLSIPDLKPVMQFMLKYDLESAQGETIRGEAFGTIHGLD